ncbi:MAG: hypothetical protein ACOH2H_05960 [Cypionkella sp.]
MSEIEASIILSNAREVRRRGAMPAAPMAMPTQTLEWPRRKSFLSLLSLAFWGRPSRAGR